MGNVAEPMANRMAKPGVAIPLPMARTDGRTNGRPNHLPESSSVPERAGEIRILTVRQPWAWAIIHQGKDVENRVRNIAGSWRGTIAIHAAKAIADGDQTLTSPLVDVLNPLLNAIPPVPRSWWANRGAIIGVVDLVGVHNGDRDAVECFEKGGEKGWCSPWAEVGPVWHLELANPRPLVEPIPYRGALGLRRLPEDVAGQVRAAVAS